MAQLETFLDYFLVEEIPVEEAINTGIVGPDGALVRTEKQARKSMYGKVLAADRQFPRSGLMVPNPIKVGDIVKTNEFGRDAVTFTIEDELPGATKYYLIRFDDIQGRVPAEPERPKWTYGYERCPHAPCTLLYGHKGDCSAS